MIIDTYVKETPEGQYQAKVIQEQSGYVVEYYKPSGEMFKLEDYSGRSIHYVQDSVNNWISSIRPLNG